MNTILSSTTDDVMNMLGHETNGIRSRLGGRDWCRKGVG